jgi:hypothetical protein
LVRTLVIVERLSAALQVRIFVLCWLIAEPARAGMLCS